MPELSRGFHVADEYYTRRQLDILKQLYDVPPYKAVKTRLNRHGETIETGVKRTIIEEYHAKLREDGLIDFDMVLSLSFRLLHERPEIARTLGSFMQLICIDEIQDTQDLQYGIVGSIVASSEMTEVFMVGDENQAIYTSLGGTFRTSEEIKQEFGLTELVERELEANYRSTQRVVDFCQNFRLDSLPVHSRSEHAQEVGTVSFASQQIDKDEVPEAIASIVQSELDSEVPPHEICIVAPRWRFVTRLGRKLVRLLPDVPFDAPGLSPFRSNQDAIWYKLSRLFLTEPAPRYYRSRLRLAGDVLHELEALIGRELAPEVRSPRRILRRINALNSDHEDGLLHLEHLFQTLISELGINMNDELALAASQQSFFDGAKTRLDNPDYNVPSDIASLRKLFRHPGGVVVNTCHGVKGEEYTSVICFGLLRGYIPHWDEIIDRDVDDEAEANRLLYVICSRAKRNIHLIAENGRTTGRGDAYETTRELEAIDYDFD